MAGLFPLGQMLERRSLEDCQILRRISWKRFLARQEGLVILMNIDSSISNFLNMTNRSEFRLASGPNKNEDGSSQDLV